MNSDKATLINLFTKEVSCFNKGIIKIYKYIYILII